MATKGTGATSIPKDGKGPASIPKPSQGGPWKEPGAGTKGGPWTKPGK